MRRMTVVVLVTLLGAVGCSKSSSHDPRVDEFGNALVAAMTARMAECQGMTADAARQMLQAQLRPDLMAEAQDAGRIALDADRAQACLDRLPTASCAELSDPGALADCVGAFVPQVEEGGDCTLFVDSETTAECIEGGCVADSDLACVTHGTCVRFAKEGEVCGWDWWDRDCADGLTCTWEDDLPRCAAVVTHTDVGALCNDSYNECSADLYCDEGTCQAKLATDEPCIDDRQCVYGDYCDGTCAPYKQVDAACTPEGSGCVSGAFCDPGTLKCTAYPTVDGTCGYNGYEDVGCIDSWCDAPLVGTSLVSISLPTGTCRAYKAEGEACTPELPRNGGPQGFGECGPAGICDAGSSTCVRFLCGGDVKR